MTQKWPDVGFTVELACGKQVYMGTLEEMAQREAAGIYGPDPCAEVEDRTNGHVTAVRKFRIGDLVRIHGGKPWTVAADDTGSPHTLDTEPAYKLTQERTGIAGGYQRGTLLVRYAYESELIPVA